MKQMYDYSSMVSGYFKKHLAGTKNVSINTIRSYRDTFTLFNHYLETRHGFKLDKLRIGNLSRDIILDFLSYLENERGYGIASRNQRLATLKSFARYVQVECPDEMMLCQSILSIDGKRKSKLLLHKMLHIAPNKIDARYGRIYNAEFLLRFFESEFEKFNKTVHKISDASKTYRNYDI